MSDCTQVTSVALAFVRSLFGVLKYLFKTNVTFLKACVIMFKFNNQALRSATNN
jgi:hypothetical protein